MPLPRELLLLQQSSQEFQLKVITKPEPFLDYLQVGKIESDVAKQTPHELGAGDEIVYAYTDVSHDEYSDFYFYSTHSEFCLNGPDYLQKGPKSLVNPHELHTAQTTPAVYSDPDLMSVPDTRIETVKTPPEPLYTIHSLPGQVTNTTPTITGIRDATNNNTHITLEKRRGGTIDLKNNRYFPTTIKLQLADKTESFELSKDLQSRVFTRNI